MRPLEIIQHEPNNGKYTALPLKCSCFKFLMSLFSLQIKLNDTTRKQSDKRRLWDILLFKRLTAQAVYLEAILDLNDMKREPKEPINRKNSGLRESEESRTSGENSKQEGSYTEKELQKSALYSLESLLSTGQHLHNESGYCMDGSFCDLFHGAHHHNLHLCGQAEECCS